MSRVQSDVQVLQELLTAGLFTILSDFIGFGLVVFFLLYRRPKPDRPATWAECIAGAVGVFALMTLIYAVIPHEWITFSDKYLQWDTTQFVFRSNQDILGLGDVRSLSPSLASPR